MLFITSPVEFSVFKTIRFPNHLSSVYSSGQGVLGLLSDALQRTVSLRCVHMEQIRVRMALPLFLIGYGSIKKKKWTCPALEKKDG